MFLMTHQYCLHLYIGNETKFFEGTVEPLKVFGFYLCRPNAIFPLLRPGIKDQKEPWSLLPLVVLKGYFLNNTPQMTP